MNYYDNELKNLQQEVMEKKRTDGKLSDLYLQRAELEEKTAKLEAAMQKEQKDVDRLNSASLTAFFYKVTGKIGEKLTKEEAEAYAAALKYQAAANELRMVEEDIERCLQRLSELQNCEDEYIKMLEERKEQIKSSGAPAAGRIMRIEERLAFLSGQQKEVAEALDAGDEALDIAGRMLKELESAEDWSTIDIIGGGLMSDIIKYDHLEKVQNETKELQHALRSFRTELADVKEKITADISVEISEFLQFADFLFDGIFTDFMVYDKIKESKARAHTTHDQIQKVISQLMQREEVIRSEQEQLEKEEEQIVLDA